MVFPTGASVSSRPEKRKQLLLLASSQLPTLNWDESLLRLALAALLGGLIGVERELREREAGLRTHLLVSLGSALFTIVGAYGFQAFLDSGASVVRADPTRIAAQIVTGIGFLGAGAIIRQGLSVRGLTTAATLWVVAAVGLASGAGYYSVAVITTALVLLALWPLRIVAYRILVRFRPEDGRLLVALPAGQPPGEVIDEVEKAGARIASLEVSQEGDRRRLAFDVVLPRDIPAARIVARIADLEHVAEVRWTD
jgi:putative Mg2+ transporter-C (MgtC) family protein